MRHIPEWIAYAVELLGMLSVFAVAGAIGFSLVRSVELVTGERTLRRRIRNQMRLDKLTKLAEQMRDADPAVRDRAIEIIKSNLALMPDNWSKGELLDAIRQNTERGRNAYAEKLLRKTVSEKSLTSKSA